MISPDEAKIRQWLDAVIPDNAEGYLHGARGIDGKFNGSGRYEFAKGNWRPFSYHWPTEAGDAVEFMAKYASVDDVYCCAYLQQTGDKKGGRTKANAASRRLAHSDVDGGLDLYDEVIDRGNGFVVASGTADHCHVFVQLADEATEEQHDAIEEALAKRLGGDAKVRSNDVLRPAGTINHKGRARGGASTLVDFIREPQPNARKLKAYALTGMLGLNEVATTNGSAPAVGDKPFITGEQDVDIPGANDPPKPVDMGRHPWIQDVLDEPHPDRSAHINHVIRECYRAGLEAPEIRWVVNQNADLVAKLALLRHRDDVLENLRKIADKWPNRQIRAAAQIAAIVADIEAGKYGDPPEDTTWEPIPLGPWLNGTVTLAKPTLGMARTDGLRLIYPGKEHAVLGETESGKTWFALGCVAAELLAGNPVVYIHYEEGDPASTLERLQLLGVNGRTIDKLLRFVAPSKPVKDAWVASLCTPPPVLVVHDGVNEAMALMDMEVKDIDGAATFRRKLVTPFRRVGAATIACDHMPMNAAPGRIEAFGSVHKGNALDGARIQLINETPFGRDKRGVSHVYVTKDRPGHLRIHGRSSTKTPGKTFMGTLVVDDEPVFTPFQMLFYAPKPADVAAADPESALADAVHDVIIRLPGHTVGSERLLFGEMRQAGHKFTEAKVRAAVDDLIVSGRLIEGVGKNRAKTYEAVAGAAASAAECGGEAI